MIYINYSHTSQEITIPVARTPVAGQDFILSLKGQVNLELGELEVTPVISPGGQLVKVTLPSAELEYGSYEYVLYQGDTILAGGVAEVGEYGDAPDEYDTEITYKQYEV